MNFNKFGAGRIKNWTHFDAAILVFSFIWISNELKNSNHQIRINRYQVFILSKVIQKTRRIVIWGEPIAIFYFSVPEQWKVMYLQGPFNVRKMAQQRETRLSKLKFPDLPRLFSFFILVNLDYVSVLRGAFHFQIQKHNCNEPKEVKFIYSEKATKNLRNLHVFFDWH